MKCIDFENHFYAPRFLDLVKTRRTVPWMEPDTQIIHHGESASCTLPIGPIVPALLDLTDRRIREMDENGVELAIVSSSLGVEQLEPGLAGEQARCSNDVLRQAIQRYPDRLRGYAILAVDDIAAAVDELERCSREPGFVGWNAFSNYNGEMLDSPRLFPLLEKAAERNLIVYIHPCFPQVPGLHDYGSGMAAAGFGFAMDVSTCLLRMIFAGVFDRLPTLKVMIGHLGEGLPFSLERLDIQSARTNKGSGTAVNRQVPGWYFRHNIWVSTSGSFSPEAFRCARDVLGIDRIVMGSDYPMESLPRTMEFLDSLPLSRDDREKLLWGNALQAFRLKL